MAWHIELQRKSLLSRGQSILFVSVGNRVLGRLGWFGRLTPWPFELMQNKGMVPVMTIDG